MINKNTVAAAVNRLATRDPYVLVQKGEDARGPLYAFNATVANRNGVLPLD